MLPAPRAGQKHWGMNTSLGVRVDREVTGSLLHSSGDNPGVHVLDRGQHTFCAVGQTVDILGFLGHTLSHIHSALPLCCKSVHTQYRHEPDASIPMQLDKNRWQARSTMSPSLQTPVLGHFPELTREIQLCDPHSGNKCVNIPVFSSLPFPAHPLTPSSLA